MLRVKDQKVNVWGKKKQSLTGKESYSLKVSQQPPWMLIVTGELIQYFEKSISASISIVDQVHCQQTGRKDFQIPENLFYLCLSFLKLQ